MEERRLYLSFPSDLLLWHVGDHVKQFVLYPLIYALCKMLNIVFRGTRCTTESQPYRGGKGEGGEERRCKEEKKKRI